MNGTNENNTQGKFIKVLKHNGNKIVTFFGVPANTILVFFAILLLILTLFPALSVILDTFRVKDPATGIVETYTGKHWYNTLAGENSVGYFWKPLGHSLLVSVLSCIFAIIFGGLVAYLITRTNLKFKKFISAIFIFPYVMPQWTLALFWKNLFINTGVPGGYMGEIQALTTLCVPEWMVYGALPISLVLGLHYAPFAYILMGGILRNMDANLEEAATILNIPRYKTFFKVTIPILKPAILSTILLVFSSALSSYSIPVKLGLPINYHTLATKMTESIGNNNSTIYGVGMVVALIMIAMGIIMLVLNNVMTNGRKSFTTVTGKSGQASKVNLGKVGVWIVSIITLIFTVLFCIGPMVSFALESLVPNPGDYSTGLTLMWWTSKTNIGDGGVFPGLFYCTEIWSALGGSILLSIICSLLAGTFGLLIGYAVAKRKGTFLANSVNGLAFLPYLLPSISLSVIFFGLSKNMASIGIRLFEIFPLLLAIILGTIKYIPFASRSAVNAMMQLSNEIEEAAIIQNVPWWKRMVRVIFPIQKSAFLSGYLLPFISCMREYDLFVMIGGNNMLLTKQMFLFSQNGYPALENASNLLLVVIILVFNWLVNKLTGASLDKGIGG